MEIPPPTPNEERALSIVIENWTTATPMQRAIAIAVLRGHDTPAKTAGYLQISIAEVRNTLGSIWGLLRDPNTDKIWIK